MLKHGTLVGIEPTTFGLDVLPFGSRLCLRINEINARSSKVLSKIDEVIDPELLMLCQLSYSVACLRIER